MRLKDPIKRDWLIALRGRRPQQVVAHESGITQGYYSQIEAGRKTPSESVARLIACDIGFDWRLFYRKEVQ